MDTSYQEILTKFPFLSLCKQGDNELIGIIQNYSTTLVSIYVYNIIRTVEEKQEFLEMGEEWWWETNRKLPINIALLNRWNFAHCVMSFNVKQLEIIAGPEVRLSNSITKRIKRRSINLVKKNQ